MVRLTLHQLRKPQLNSYKKSTPLIIHSFIYLFLSLRSYTSEAGATQCDAPRGGHLIYLKSYRLVARCPSSSAASLVFLHSRRTVRG